MGGGVFVVVLFVVVVIAACLVLNYFSSSGPVPVANFFGNNTLGVTCTHGTPHITGVGREIVVKCQ